MKSKRWLLIAVVVLMFFSGQEAEAGDEVLPLMVLEVPPWFVQKDDGTWDGLGTELGRVLSERAGFRAEAVLLPWNRGINSLEEGKRLLFVNLSRTPQRQEFVDFIGVSAFEQSALLLRRENAGIPLATLDDLTRPGYLWGLRENTFYSEEFNNRLRDDPAFAGSFESVAQFGVNLYRVKAGRMVGAFGDYLGMRYRVENDPELRDLLVVTVPFLPPNPVYFGVSRKLPEEERRRLRLAYEELSREGAFAAIVEKWRGVRP